MTTEPLGRLKPLTRSADGSLMHTSVSWPLGAAVASAGGRRAVEMVGGARWVDVPGVADERGEIAFLQHGGGLSFSPRRLYYLYDVPDAGVRGDHAHRVCHQLLVCVRGRVAVELDDGHRTARTILDDPRRALHVPPMVWNTLSRFSRDAVLLVVASHDYDADDYIRDHDDFTATAVLAAATGRS